MALKIHKESFKTLNDFIKTIDSRPLNKPFQTLDYNKLASVQDETNASRKWFYTNNFSDARDILRKGYHEPLKEMKKAILKIGNSDDIKRPKLKNDMVGFVPHIPNTLMNLPQTMINKEVIKKPNKNITLNYNFADVSDVDPKKLIKGGINFISLVNALEKQGYRVKVNVLCVMVTKKTVASFTINVKQEGQRLNLLKLSFPLVHPSMLRRFGLRWLETYPELKDKDFIGGYGTTLDRKFNGNYAMERSFLKANRIIQGDKIFYCNVKECYSAYDLNNLATIMQLNRLGSN